MDEAQSRLQNFSAIHRRLYDPSKANLPAHYQLSELCNDLMAANGGNSIRCIVEATSAVLDLSRLTIVSMLVSEIITNSIKHAFEHASEGVIVVKLTNQNGEFVLTVSDNGIGFPVNNMPAEKRSLGLKIISSFAAQLGCQPNYVSNNGTTVEFVFKELPDY
jgi:two-component sensor histidine kinase